MKKLKLINLTQDALAHIKGGEQGGGGSTPACSCSCDCGEGSTIPAQMSSSISSNSRSGESGAKILNPPNPN